MTFALTTLIFLSIIIGYEIYSKKKRKKIRAMICQHNDIQMKQLIEIIGGDSKDGSNC